MDKIAKKHNRTKSQIILKWSMQHGVLPIVGSRNMDHISENFSQYNFTLAEEEMKEINSLGIPLRISQLWGWDPTTI